MTGVRGQLVAVLILICHAAGTATPPDACLVTYGGATSSQRSLRYVLVPNNTFALQAIPAAALTGTVLLPRGFNYSLNTLIVALEPSLPWSNTTAAVELAFYQVPRPRSSSNALLSALAFLQADPISTYLPLSFLLCDAPGSTNS